MILQGITELSLVTVLYRGIANKECIALKATQAVNLGQFGLMIGYFQPGGLAAPFKDRLFWFGDGLVQPRDWILVYSGAGSARKTNSKDDESTIYVVHWGQELTMFANNAIVPILFRVDAVNIGKAPVDQPQYPVLALADI